MKKQIALAVLATGVSLGALAQGSLGDILDTFYNDGITTPGLEATNPVSATTWYTGNATIALYYAAPGAVTQSQINAINALDGLGEGGAAALILLGLDGFVEVSTPLSPIGGPAGAVSGYAVDSYGDFYEGSNTISLLPPVPTYGSGWLAMVVTAVGGQYNGYEGVLAWWQPNLGGNPATAVAAPIVMDPAGLNLVLTPTPPIIPTTPITPIQPPGTWASITYMLPEMAYGGSGQVPQFNPTNGQLASVSLAIGAEAGGSVRFDNFGSQQYYYCFYGSGTFSISLPGSSLAGSTSNSTPINAGFVAAGFQVYVDPMLYFLNGFNLVTNTSQAADLEFFTGTNSVTVNEDIGFYINSLVMPAPDLFIFTYPEGYYYPGSALTYYYAPPPKPIIGLTYGSYSVLPTFSNLIVGTNYQLQVSTSLNGTFTNYGPAFAATNSSMVYTQYFDIANWSQLFLRVKTSP
jgi:hypothetical protein